MSTCVYGNPENDLNRHLIAVGRQSGKSGFQTEEQVTGAQLQELINEQVRTVYLHAKLQQDLDELVRHSPMTKFTQRERVKYLPVRDGVLDIENGVALTDQVPDEDFPITISNTVEEVRDMTPASMGAIPPDDEGMNERNIEKRYAALMGRKKSKLDRTATDEKALQAAQEKRQRKANRRRAVSARATHAG